MKNNSDSDQDIPLWPEDKSEKPINDSSKPIIITSQEVKKYFVLGFIIGLGIIFLMLPIFDVKKSVLEKFGIVVITTLLGSSIGYLKSKKE